MNPQLKRALIIAGFTIVVIGMLWVIYLVFFKPGPAETPTNNGSKNNINGLPLINNGNVNGTPTGNINGLTSTNTNSGPNQVADGGATRVTPVNPAASAGLTVGTSGGLQYYDRPSGKFFRVSPDSTTRTVMTDAIYKDVQTITWNPAGDKAVLTFPDGSNIMYDFSAKKQVTLPPELSDFIFSPSGDQIASKYLDAANQDNQWLMVSKPDGTSSQSVEQLGENAGKVTTSWSPNNTVVATYEKSTTSARSEIIFLGKNNENLPSANVEGRGFIPNWSPDGSRLLFSTYSDMTNNAPHLYIMNGSVDGLGQNIIDLNVDTRADKCTFSQDNHTIFCAVSYYPVADSGPVPSKAYTVPDNIYAIDLLRGATTLIARPVDQNGRQSYSIGSISLSADESSLFFTDVQTGYVQKILLR